MCLSGLLFIKTGTQFDSQMAKVRQDDSGCAKNKIQRCPQTKLTKLMSRVNEQFGAVAYDLVLWSVATFIYTEL